MTRYQFFDAFGQIDSSYLLAVEDILSGGDKVVRSPRKPLFRTILIAAAIAALTGATAYAASVFGLPSRLIRDPGAVNSGSALSQEAMEVLDALRPIHHRDYISLSGVAGSPEYRAAAEWLAFRGAYADRKTAEQIEQGKPYYEWRDLERSFAPDAQTREICRLYQVWDGAMWEKLQEIAGKYQLSLHTERTMILGDWIQIREHGKYEDGSFVLSSTAAIEQQLCIYELYVERDGALPCDDMTASCTDEYGEWEYTNSHGQDISIAMRDVSTNETWSQVDYLLFYSGEGVTITVKATYGHPLTDSAADETLYAEKLADSIDFASVASAKSPEDALAVLKGD